MLNAVKDVILNFMNVINTCPIGPLLIVGMGFTAIGCAGIAFGRDKREIIPNIIIGFTILSLPVIAACVSGF